MSIHKTAALIIGVIVTSVAAWQLLSPSDHQLPLVIRAASGEAAKEAAAQAITATANLEIESSRKLVKSVVKGMNLGQDVPKDAITGYLAYRTIKVCMDANQKSPMELERCVAASHMATDWIRRVEGPSALLNFTDQAVDLIYLCIPLLDDITAAQLQGLDGVKQEELARKAWSQIGCQDKAEKITSSVRL